MLWLVPSGVDAAGLYGEKALLPEISTSSITINIILFW